MASDRKAVVQHAWDMVRGIVSFNVLGGGKVDLQVANLTDEVARTALFHGLTQKCSDKCAIPRDTKTGRSATAAEKFAALKGMVDHLNAGGTWVMRAAVQPSLDRAALFSAVAHMLLGVRSKAVEGMTQDTAAAHVARQWQDKPDEELRLRLTNKDVAAEYARLTARGGEAAEMFAGLE